MGTADEIAKLHELLRQGVISQEEFDRAKARLLTGLGAPLASGPLRLSNQDRWIAGVCGGIAQATGVESWIWRVLMVCGLFLGGAAALVYLMLWIFVPRATH